METKEEVWKSIPCYEGFYEASNLGRVKSLSRIIERRLKGPVNIKECILKLHPSIHGYLQVELSKNKKRKLCSVHRLVALAFFGESNLCVNHKDFNKKNNNIDNLEWMTHRQNSNHYNLSQDKTSKYSGVGFSNSKNAWSARAELNGKLMFLGNYKEEVDASNAYQYFINNADKINNSFPFHGRNKKSKLGKENKGSIKIIQFKINGEIVKTWDCISDVQRQLNIKRANICKALKGKRNSAGGFIWKYVS